MHFNISVPDKSILPLLEDKINNLTKPKGSLGRLESLAMQIGWIQQTLSPVLNNPQNIIFAADHGIVAEGVSQSPKEVTMQVINNFLSGGQGINFLARQHNFKLKFVDAGIDYDFPYVEGLINKKIRKGTRNYLYESAMTKDETIEALKKGAEMVEICYNEGTNIISFGEMGIGNTSTSSMWMTLLAGISLDICVGAGSGLNDEGVKHKKDVLKRALENYSGTTDVMDVITWFGGLEMVMAVGGMLKAAELGMIILVDGFIMTNCMLAASKINKNVLHYAIFTHQGDESGHKLLLNHLNADPLLFLDLRLGEGTGALCAYPIIDSSVRMINEMNSFSNAAITKYF